MGLTLEPDDFFPNIGGKAPETIPKFLRGRRASMSVSQIHARKKELLDELLDTVEIRTLSSSELIPWLSGWVPMAIASSGSRPGIDKILSRLGWTSSFQTVVTGEDVPNGKPAPDLFLEAARRLGIDASACFVFEDTDDGVEAARRAGMRVMDVRRATVEASTDG